jgi:hypothetical protein
MHDPFAAVILAFMMKMEVYHEKPVTVDSSLNKFLIGIS